MSKNLSRYGKEEAIRLAAASMEDCEYGAGLHVAIEVNKAKMAEITAALEAARAEGKTPDEVTFPPLGPEDHDLVIRISTQQIRTLRVIQQKLAANTVWHDCELLRKPLREVMDRAQLAFDGGPGTNQA